MSEIYDYSYWGDLKLLIEREKNDLVFKAIYHGQRAEMSKEGLKMILDLYGHSLITKLGKEFSFEGNFEKEVGDIEKMGYSTNLVVAFDGKVLKSYRSVGSMEPEIMESVGNISPEILGWGTYDGKFIQVITRRVGGREVGSIFYESHRRFLDGKEWREVKIMVPKIAATICSMHAHLEKFGVERIRWEDIRRWRDLVRYYTNAAHILINPDELFGEMEDKEKIITHQDLHLSQMIFDGNSIKIIDFEGEPLREKKEEKLQPVRDIATVARALSYIADGNYDEWVVEMMNLLYSEYRKKCKYSFDYGDFWDWMIEKAAYEVYYETKFRPDLVRIPKKSLKWLIENRRDAI